VIFKLIDIYDEKVKYLQRSREYLNINTANGEREYVLMFNKISSLKPRLLTEKLSLVINLREIS